MIKYAIIDDEPIAHRIVRSYGDQLSHLQYQGSCYDALEALAFLSKEEVDLLFLDINMPRLSGFDLLRSMNHRPAVIITSAYQEHALEGYEWEVLDYLLKPFSLDRFLKAVNRYKPTAPKVTSPPEPTDAYFVKVGKTFHQVPLEELLWVEAKGNYCKYQLKTRNLMVNQKVSDVEALLPSSHFLRVHKSFIIATAKIESISGNQLIVSGQRIPVGKTYKRALHQFLANVQR